MRVPLLRRPSADNRDRRHFTAETPGCAGVAPISNGSSAVPRERACALPSLGRDSAIRMLKTRLFWAGLLAGALTLSCSSKPASGRRALGRRRASWGQGSSRAARARVGYRAWRRRPPAALASCRRTRACCRAPTLPWVYKRQGSQRLPAPTACSARAGGSRQRTSPERSSPPSTILRRPGRA